MQICACSPSTGSRSPESTYHSRTASPATVAELADTYAAHEVFCLFRDKRGLYGVLKLLHALRRRGRDIGRGQVARLMGICGIAGIVRDKHRTITTGSDPSASWHPDLIDRKWDTPTQPDLWWVAD